MEDKKGLEGGHEKQVFLGQLVGLFLHDDACPFFLFYILFKFQIIYTLTLLSTDKYLTI